MTKVSDNDVILEAGNGSHNRPGNIRYRKIIQQEEPAYTTTNARNLKDSIAHDIINQIKPGRFLIPMKDGSYEIASTEKVLDKIKQAIRDRKKIRDRKEKSMTRKLKKTPEPSQLGGKERKKKKGSQIDPISLVDDKKRPAREIDTDMIKMMRSKDGKILRELIKKL